MNKHITTFLLLILLISTSAFCRSKKVELDPLPDAENLEVYDKKWKKYGAYYDKDQLIITNIIKIGYCCATFEVFKQIKIITVEGAEHGTVPVHRWSKKITHFEIHLYNANGEEVPIPVKKIKKDYIKSGKVVFPKVTAGSTIWLNIVFRREYVYYTYFENWIYYHQIPIRVRRVVFAHNHSCTYETETFGNRVTFQKDQGSNKHFKSYTFLIRDFEPRPKLDYLDYKTITEPRIVFRLTKSHQKNFATSDVKRDFISKCKREVNEISSELIKEIFTDTSMKKVLKIPDTLKRARKILKWVQKNGRSAGGKRVVRNVVIPVTKSSNINIASVCHKMFKRAGIKSRILITPRLNKHIHDSTFLLYSNDNIGGAAITINDKEYIAYPYASGYELGEYPLSYMGALCMDLKNKKIMQLPPPKRGEEWIRDIIVLDLSSFPGKYTLIREFKKNSASDYRYDFINMNKKAKRNKLEEVVKYYKESNELESYSLKNLHKYEKPFIATVAFKNDDMPIQHRNSTIFQLNNFYYDYFEDITIERSEDVYIHYKATLIDELEILKIPAKKIIPNVRSKNLSNKFFSVECNKSETDTSYIFQRILTYDKIDIPKEELKDIYNDCVELNKIKNSNVIIEN